MYVVVGGRLVGCLMLVVVVYEIQILGVEHRCFMVLVGWLMIGCCLMEKSILHPISLIFFDRCVSSPEYTKAENSPLQRSSL